MRFVVRYRYDHIRTCLETSETKFLGTMMGYDDCLDLASADAECGPIAQGGGALGDCVCVRPGGTCCISSRGVTWGNSIYWYQCPPWDGVGTSFVDESSLTIFF